MTELAVILAIAFSSQFDASDAGIGGRIGWQAMPLVVLEAELVHYPGHFADDPAFSRARFEGLFGATVGPRLGRVRPFVRVRPGFLRVQEAPEPFACIMIFPPPLACQLAAGHTLTAIDIGGGVDVSVGERTFLRIDAGDRLLKYPGPAFDSDRNVHEEAFFGHDVRIAASGGIRF
jgi:hypothetical protein